MSDDPSLEAEEAPGAPSDDLQEASELDLEEAGLVAADLLVRVSEAEAKRDESLDDLRRVAAEFDNYRKRVVREQERAAARATERLLTRLLPVLDDLERALDAAEHHEEAKVLEGVRMTRAALEGALAAEGVEEIPAEGAFDPHVHEALLATPAEGIEPGAIVQVVQRGYRLGELVLRPARVVVAE
ncbi:MAG: nucleotide exchange factor GrpE [Thermoleophilia bacterium]|nr:nucleotide exchange factor GrpE [Thermoleophilia bacterium]